MRVRKRGVGSAGNNCIEGDTLEACSENAPIDGEGNFPFGAAGAYFREDFFRDVRQPSRRLAA